MQRHNLPVLPWDSALGLGCEKSLLCLQHRPPSASSCGCLLGTEFRPPQRALRSSSAASIPHSKGMEDWSVMNMGSGFLHPHWPHSSLVNSLSDEMQPLPPSTRLILMAHTSHHLHLLQFLFFLLRLQALTTHPRVEELQLAEPQNCAGSTPGTQPGAPGSPCRGPGTSSNTQHFLPLLAPPNCYLEPSTKHSELGRSAATFRQKY